MLDYHLHLWTHRDESVWFRLDQIAEYCDEAARHGVHEVALTEHAHRFVDVMSVAGPFWQRLGHEPTSQMAADYFDFHTRSALEDYVTLARAAQDNGLPVKIGLEVDYVPGRMGHIGELLAQYPFDVLIGSVHWLGTWMFDDYDHEASKHEWATRDVEDVWDLYTTALEELAATRSVDVLAHSDLVKVAGYVSREPELFWQRMAAAAADVDVSIECSSAGWVKPIGEQYPAAGLLDRYVAAGLTFTTASDAHQRARVGERADDLADLLESRGVFELASYTRRQRTMVPLRGL